MTTLISKTEDKQIKELTKRILSSWKVEEKSKETKPKVTKKEKLCNPK